MLKGLIILGLVVLLIGFVINAIRKALGHFSNDAGTKNAPQNQQSNKPQNHEQNHTQNQMLPCKQCGTFVSTQESFSHKGAHFCSKECLDLSLKNG